MKSFLASMFSAQTPPPGSQEGLPYWILWFLLCIILLLLSFIFLRDKDLRQRLNQFLFGAKKRLIRFRLNTRLKIAHRKKNEIYSELGKQAWEGNLKVEGAEKIDITLHKLEEKKTQLQEDLEITLEKISVLKKNLEDKSLKNGIKIKGKKAELKIDSEKLSDIRNRLKETKSTLAQKRNLANKMEKELSALDKSLNELQKHPQINEEALKQGLDQFKTKKEDLNTQLQQIKQNIEELKQKNVEQESEEKSLKESIHDESLESKRLQDTSKKEVDEIKKEIHEWDKHRVKIQEKMQRIERRKMPLFKSLGALADETRIKHESLVLLYSHIDRADQKIMEIERQLEELD